MRSIPACAGEPCAQAPAQCPRRVDPRVCGGAKLLNGLALREYGRSPRVRGSRCACRRTPGCGGSIPACAGEPLARRDQGAQPGVDPRVCGGAVLPVDQHGFGEGRSPRVRGSRREGGDGQLDRRSIPACAGEPVPRRAAPCATGVDPRVCGGARKVSAVKPSRYGRSPRVRGSRLEGQAGSIGGGSIPACAGGATWPKSRCSHCRGRSPRVRGSPFSPLRTHPPSGSIPACAGEPRRAPSAWCRQGVDPRVCGGARFAQIRKRLFQGRSPRVRGSLFNIRCLCRLTGSIPACAGEPRLARSRPRRHGVDPRVCGGAIVSLAVNRKHRGRSPRVRGSRLYCRDGKWRPGSIPACAGEPQLFGREYNLGKVDPRVCGGAVISS